MKKLIIGLALLTLTNVASAQHPYRACKNYCEKNWAGPTQDHAMNIMACKDSCRVLNWLLSGIKDEQHKVGCVFGDSKELQEIITKLYWNGAKGDFSSIAYVTYSWHKKNYGCK